MKRYIALTFAVIFVLSCFTSCKKKVEGAEVYSNLAGDEFALVTDKNGEPARDQAGNVIEAVTDEKGNNVKDENGEIVTQIHEIKNALVIGDNIELQDYYITIPKGWTNNDSFQGIQIKKENSEDLITIEQIKDKKLVEVEKNCLTLVEAGADRNEGSVVTKKSIKINDKDCTYYAVYIPKGVSGNPVYYGYAIYQGVNGIYRFYISGARDIEADNKEILSIIQSVEFKKAEENAPATTVAAETNVQ